MDRRTLRAPAAEDVDLVDLPVVSARAGKLLGFDGGGQPVVVALGVSPGGGGSGGSGGTGSGGTPGNGTVGADQLDAYLSQRINLIGLVDPVTVVPGSVWTALSSETAARSAGDAANTQSMQLIKTTLEGSIAGYAASLLLLKTDLESSIAALATQMQSPTGDTAVAIQTLQTQANGLATAVTALQSTSGSHESTLISYGATLAGQGGRINTLDAQLLAHAGVLNNQAGVNADYALQLTQLSTRAGSAESSISSLWATVGSQATSITQLAATNGTQQASLEWLASVDAIGQATYTIKTDVNGYVAGFGISNRGDLNGSAIIFRADRFAMVHPSAPAGGIYPFELVGGQVRIASASIGEARIGILNLAPYVATTLWNTAYSGGWLSGSGMGGWYTAGATYVTFPVDGDLYVSASINQGFANALQSWRCEIWVGGVLRSARGGASTEVAPGMLAAVSVPAGTHLVELKWAGLSADIWMIEAEMHIIGRWR